MSKLLGELWFRIVVLVSLTAAATIALAQSQPPSGSPPPEQQSPASKSEDKPVDIGIDTTFKVNVDVVNILFNVKDKRGALIPDLRKDDFALSEDGAKQTIKFFAAESNLPLTLGILLDTSGSQARVLPMEQEMGSVFLKEVLREKDLAFLINFDVNVELLQDFTSSPGELRRAMQGARINTGGGGGGPSIPGVGQGPVPIEHIRSTALYD